MDRKTLEKMRIVHKTAVFNNTLYSYVSAIAKMFLTNPSRITETCDALGLTEEELFAILAAPTFSSMSLLDEIVEMNTPQVKNSNTLLGR